MFTKEDQCNMLEQLPEDMFFIILSFLDFKSVLHFKNVCRSNHERIGLVRQISKHCSSMHPTSDYQNQFYCSLKPFSCLSNISSIITIRASTKGHDQGWASERGTLSHTWAEIGFVELEGQQPYHRLEVLRNPRASTTFTKGSHTISSESLWWKEHRSAIAADSELGLWARSKYPEWKCYLDGGLTIDIVYLRQ